MHVKDTGIGISPEHGDTIFQEFRQISEGMCRSYEGIGLGLSLAKKITEVMGGTLDFESSAGQGSTFTVALPSIPAAPEALRPQSSDREPLCLPRVEQGRESPDPSPALPLVLLVEDNTTNQMITALYLEKVCTVLHAEDGLTAPVRRYS